MVPPDASATEVPGVGVQAFQQVNEYDGNSSALDLLATIPPPSTDIDLTPNFIQINDFSSENYSALDLNGDQPNSIGVNDFPSIFTSGMSLGIGAPSMFSQTNDRNWSKFPNENLFGGSFLENLLGGFNTGDPSGMLVNILDFVSGRGAGGLLNRGIEGILHGSNGLGLSNTFGIGGTTITNAVGLSTPALIPTTLNSSGQTFMDDLFGDLFGGNGGGNGATAQNPLNSSAGPSSYMLNNNPTSVYAPVWGYPGEMQSPADKPYHYVDNWNNFDGPGGIKGSNLLETFMFAGFNEPPLDVPFGGDNHPRLAQGFKLGREISVFDKKELTYDINQNSHEATPVLFRGMGTDGKDVNYLQLPPNAFESRVNIFPWEDDIQQYNTQEIPENSIVRGGLNFALARSATDTVRMDNFMKTGAGLAFILKQESLGKTNPYLQEENSDINREYDVTNTMASIMGAYAGSHYPKHGANKDRNPGGNTLGGSYLKYQYKAKEEGNLDTMDFSIGSGGNRLLTLRKNVLFVGFGGDPNLYSYPGGFNSTYGIGETIIKRWEITEGELDHNGHPRTYNAIKNATPSSGTPRYNAPFVKGDIKPGYITDKNAGKPKGIDKYILSPNIRVPNTAGPRVIYHGGYKPKFSEKSSVIVGSNIRPNHYIEGIKHQKVVNTNLTYRREERTGLGDPGAHVYDTKPVSKGDGGGGWVLYGMQTTAADVTVDKINALDIINTDGNQFQDPRFNDMIPFRFEAINTDEPELAETMAFRAFLDDYSDDFNADWNEFQYNGRAEPFFTYKGFKRDISFSFKVAAQSRVEMMPLYRKLNYLVSQTAPEYKNLRMRGNFMKLTIGDLVDRTPGIIRSVGLKWQKDYPWEIALDKGNAEVLGQDTDMLILPHVLDVSVKFTPVHSFVPQRALRGSDGKIKELSPFIIPSSINGDRLPSEDWAKTGAADSMEDAHYDKLWERLTGQEFERMDTGLSPNTSAYRDQFENIQTPDAKSPDPPRDKTNSYKTAINKWEEIRSQSIPESSMIAKHYNGKPKYNQDIIDNWDKFHPINDTVVAGPDLEIAYAESTAPSNNPDQPAREREYVCYSTEYENSILVEWKHKYYGWVLIGGLFDKHANWVEFQTGESTDGTNCTVPALTTIEAPFTAQVLATKLIEIENTKQATFTDAVTFTVTSGGAESTQTNPNIVTVAEE